MESEFKKGFILEKVFLFHQSTPSLSLSLYPFYQSVHHLLGMLCTRRVLPLPVIRSLKNYSTASSVEKEIPFIKDECSSAVSISLFYLSYSSAFCIIRKA